MEVKVRVEGEFYWGNLWQGYVFDGTVYLPTDSEGYLLPILLNEDVHFFHERLEKNWGLKSIDREERFNFVSIRANTLDELKEKVNTFIQEEIEKLKKVKEENLKKTAKQKEIVMEFII